MITGPASYTQIPQEYSDLTYKRNVEYISSVRLSCIKIKRENNAAGELCAQSSVKQELK